MREGQQEATGFKNLKGIKGVCLTESEDPQDRMHEEDPKGTQGPRNWQGLRPVRLGEMSHAYRGHQQFHEMRYDAARAHHDHRPVTNVVSPNNLRTSNRERLSEFSIRIAGDDHASERSVLRRRCDYLIALNRTGAETRCDALGLSS